MAEETKRSTIRLKSGKEEKLDSLLGRNFSIVCFDIDPSELLSLEIAFKNNNY